MRVEFLKASNDDYNELVDFANYVFSHSGNKTDFPRLLPKLYKKNYDTMSNHYVAKEDGKIKAVVGVFPMELNVLNKKLKVAGIGTVSVHPYSRGSGYMKELMNMALRDMKIDKFDLSCLGGKRQRYEYFSYTPCGEKFNFEVNKDNIKHKLGNELNSNILLKEINENDFELIEMCQNLYNKSSFRFEREKEKFLDIIKSWYSSGYAIFKGKDFIGYLVASEDKKIISEMYINKEESFLDILGIYLYTNNLFEVKILMPSWEKEKIKLLQSLSEYSSISDSYQYNVLNYENIIETLLKFKSSYDKISDGSLKMDIHGYGKFNILVDNSKVTVEKFEGKCDISINHLEAMQILFSKFGKYMLDDSNIDREVINSWLPLPLYINHSDEV